MDFKKAFISELKPARYNPRKDLQPSDPEYQRIKKSIETFGYVDPVIVNSDYTVIGGHQRLKVLKEMGEATIDVVVVDLPKEQEKALNVALNKISGEWDFSQLSIVLSELKEADFDISITGFSDEELRRIDENLFGEPVDDPTKEWAGMPECNQEDKTAYRTIHIHFKNESDIELFGKCIDQKITEKTRYLWYPKMEIDRAFDKRYK